MDSLLTAFLSSGSGNGMMGIGIRENDLFCEWDFQEQFTPFLEGEDFKCSKKTCLGKFTTSEIKLEELPMISHGLSFEIDALPTISASQTVKSTEQYSNISFASYLNHQMYHKLVQKKISTMNFIQPNCCLTLGCLAFADHAKMQSHYCCKSMMKFLNLSSPCTSLCTCDMLAGALEISCEQHKLLFSDTHRTCQGYSWTVAFSETKNHNMYHHNPLFDLNMADLNANVSSSDSFDIEFASDDCGPSVQNSINSDCSQSLYYFDNDDDEGSESIDYETSSDEDENADIDLNINFDADDKLCFEADFIQFDIVSKPFVPKICFKKNRGSKYHVNCVTTGEKETNTINYDVNRKDKKCVRFAGKTEHPIIAWKHAYKQCRKSEWVKVANDRAHFQRRIQNVSKVLNPVLLKALEKINST